MKPLRSIVLALAVTVTVTGVSPVRGAVLLDDVWEDGDRTGQNPPEDSAWYASVVSGEPTLAVGDGFLTGRVLMFVTNVGILGEAE